MNPESEAKAPKNRVRVLPAGVLLAMACFLFFYGAFKNPFHSRFADWFQETVWQPLDRDGKALVLLVSPEDREKAIFVRSSLADNSIGFRVHDCPTHIIISVPEEDLGRALEVTRHTRSLLSPSAAKHHTEITH